MSEQGTTKEKVIIGQRCPGCGSTNTHVVRSYDVFRTMNEPGPISVTVVESACKDCERTWR